MWVQPIEWSILIFASCVLLRPRVFSGVLAHLWGYKSKLRICLLRICRRARSGVRRERFGLLYSRILYKYLRRGSVIFAVSGLRAYRDESLWAVATAFFIPHYFQVVRSKTHDAVLNELRGSFFTDALQAVCQLIRHDLAKLLAILFFSSIIEMEHSTIANSEWKTYMNLPRKDCHTETSNENFGQKSDLTVWQIPKLSSMNLPIWREKLAQYVCRW